ncbi:hypothetical protein A4X13_0g6861 [Tilletia indica]|uniref:Uncharacterized protein n=1 Tax=Tilletia indica TaxID=43049 RepID=A0A8T8SN17_9BASI|nr:hypothetical protein A4X13_0g6861 [Tilletia indica]
MVSSAQNKFNQVEGFAYNWDLIRSEQERLDYLVQRPEPMRNVISGAEQLKRKLILYGDLFLPNNGRYKKLIEDYERKERPSATAPGTGEPSSTKTTSYRLDELIVGPRSLRVSLQSSISTGPAFDVFRYEPYHDLFKAGLPELATNAASLWAYQQPVICTVFAVGEAPCDLYVRHRPEFLIKEALDTLRTLPRFDDDTTFPEQTECPPGTGSAPRVDCGAFAPEYEWGFEEGEVGAFVQDAGPVRPHAAERSLCDVWATHGRTLQPILWAGTICSDHLRTRACCALCEVGPSAALR